MKNQDIKRKAKQAGVTLWRIADELGISDMTLTRRLRRELPPEEKAKICEIISELAGERDAND